ARRGSDPIALYSCNVYGRLNDHSSARLASRPDTSGIRVTEGCLRLTEKLLCEQRRNLQALPEKDRRTGLQCTCRGSRPVVLDGVTTVQGLWENQRQGEGV